MAIDKRGMGLTISCPKCQGLVRVPTVSETSGSSPDSVSMPIEGLADALEESRKELDEMKQKLASVENLRVKLEEQSKDHEEKLTVLRREFGKIQSALDQVTMTIVDSSESQETL